GELATSLATVATQLDRPEPLPIVRVPTVSSGEVAVADAADDDITVLGTALADAAAPVSPAAVAEPAPPDADLTVIAEPAVRPSRRWGRRRFEKSARSSAKPTPPAGEPRVYDFMAEDDPDFVDDTTGVARTRDRERNRDRKSERQRDRHVAYPTIDGTT